jgi:pyruvate ferredoxin oxidoreductase gamma subunit
MYRIRLHGRGGQGIKTAGQILGSAFFLEGFEVQDAPRYGAERRGAPIFAYVRAARAPIHERGVITRPDLVIVADETLVPVPAAGVLQGISPRTVLLIASGEPAAEWQRRLGIEAVILALNVDAEAGPTGTPSHVGAVCAGAAARLAGVIARESLGRAVREEVARYGSAAVLDMNLRQALGAFDAMAPHAGQVGEGGQLAAEGYAPPDWIDLPFEDARTAAPDIRAALTSELADTGLWRTLRPVIDHAHCNRCTWICGTLCPESAIRVDAAGRPDIDYAHCKGCSICVAVCPPHAIRAVPEHAGRGVQA